MSSRLDPRTPVLIGAGQVLQRDTAFESADEPAALMARAVAAACADATLDAVPDADSIRVVELYTCRYADPGRSVARQVGLNPRESAITTAGGNSPQALVNATAREISDGTLDLAILVGGECWRTRSRARAEGFELGWGDRHAQLQVDRVIGDTRSLLHPTESARGIGPAPLTYALLESAVRAHSGRTPSEHQAHLGALWAKFSDAAAANPHAWSRTARSAAEITTVSPSNRIISEPYTKAMNANNQVDMSAALVMCSVEAATRLGVPIERWVFPLVAVDCHDTIELTARPSLGYSTGVERGAETVLELAGIGLDDIEHLDLYSCFPSSVQIGRSALGVPDDRPLTVTGGLAFAGGPWNNYAMHAIATMMARLRESPSDYGLVWANGGYVTKHAFGLYSGTPQRPFQTGSPQTAIDAHGHRPRPGPVASHGSGTLEAYTVTRSRDGEATRAHASCLLADGRRAWGNTTAPDTLSALTADDWIGTSALITADGEIVL